MTRWQRFLWWLGFTGYAHPSNAEELLTFPSRKPVTFERFDPPRDLVHVPEPITFRTVFDDEWASCARPELNKGDTVTVIAGGQQHRFRVTDVRQDGATTVASVEPYDWKTDGL